MRPFICVILVAALTGCGDSLGPGVAVSLRLHSVDGAPMPVSLRTAAGDFVTLGFGRLQGTNWGHACGFALRLAEGPLTAVDVPECRLREGEEKVVTITLRDSRFPEGPHDYRFVP